MTIPASWLRHPLKTLDFDEAQRLELQQLEVPPKQWPRMLERAAATGWPRRWQTFLALQQPGDEVWWFDSPEAAWRELSDAAGYALLREGEIIETLCCRRS